MPAVKSIEYCFHRITVDTNGLVLDPIGWENFTYALKSDATFVKNLTNSITNGAIKIPVMMFLSMFLAIVMNNEFPGRLLFRTILFLPVIFAADQVLRTMSLAGTSGEMTDTSNDFFIMTTGASGFVKEVISSFGILTPVIEKFTAYAGKMFDLLWSIGIQIILFVIGLKSIPPYLYEVAEMEGATAWETFWKITFPLLVPSMLLCLVFSIIDFFNTTTNAVVRTIDTNMLARIDYAAAQSWIYSGIILGFVLIAYALVSRKIVKLD
jgi:ABC-type sugar transport system permease subunit